MNTQKELFKEKCEMCPRTIKGFSESMLKYNMKSHLQKHKKEMKE